MQKIRLLLISIIVIFCVFSNTLSAHSFYQEDMKEEYKLYATVIKSENLDIKADPLIIERMTSPDRSILPDSDEQKSLLKYIKSLTEDMLNDYNIQNKLQIELQDEFKLQAKIILISNQELKDIFQQDEGGWESFYKKFPNSHGCITLSNIGYDFNKEHALIFVGHHCGLLCASGTYYILKKEDGEWKIAEKSLVWVS